MPACIPRDVFRRTLLLDDVIQLYCDFEGLFRFKETGYLREFIAGLELEKEKQLEADEEMARKILSADKPI